MTSTAGTTPDADSDDAQILAWIQSRIDTIDDIFLRRKLTEASPTDSLTGLGIDSLSRVNLLYEIIDTLGKEAPENVVEDWHTVADLVAYTRTLLG
jgi:acyl carrier protein